MEQKEIKCTVIIPAAGQGKRFGNSLPKQFLNLEGIPIIIRTLMVCDKIDFINHIVIAVDTSYKKLLRDYIKSFGITKKITLVKGGKERQDSICNSIDNPHVQNSDIILVHDAVRPFASTKLYKDIFDSALKYGAVIPGIKPKDTIKLIDPKGFVNSTMMRQFLRHIQTPQGFKTDIFIEIYRQMVLRKMIVTDDASLAERIGVRVKVIDGEEENIKITTSIDMLLAESILRNNELKKLE
jgi:2-C-methyl-D-erythritol 4-phosphate cytidylyltransferase